MSGDARRMRSLYRYEDAEENLTWVTESLGNDYFEENKMHLKTDKKNLSSSLWEKKISLLLLKLTKYYSCRILRFRGMHLISENLLTKKSP